MKLQIDRLILENLDLSPRQRRQLQAAVEAELSRLLTAQGLPAQVNPNQPIAALPIDVQVAPATSSTQIGQQIAQSIYTHLTSASSPSPQSAATGNSVPS